jgi:hypothetical protein
MLENTFKKHENSLAAIAETMRLFIIRDDSDVVTNGESAIKSQDIEKVKDEESNLKKSLTDISSTLSKRFPFLQVLIQM